MFVWVIINAWQYKSPFGSKNKVSSTRWDSPLLKVYLLRSKMRILYDASIDTRSVDSMIDAMLKVRDLGNNERKELIAKGMARSAHFNWDESVRRTIEVYRTVTG
jgi:hypothetical protein